MAVVAAVTGAHGNPTYARELAEETSRTGDEGVDVNETELDEKTRRQVEAQIEHDVVSAEKAGDADVKEGHGDETSGDQEDAVAAGAQDEEAAEGGRTDARAMLCHVEHRVACRLADAVRREALMRAFMTSPCKLVFSRSSSVLFHVSVSEVDC